MKITVYTDGSCDPKTTYGSYGVVITARLAGGRNPIRKLTSTKYVDTTNNRMELKGIIKALDHIDPGHTIDVYSDSEYCVNTINKWLANWIKTKKLHTKKNPELWEVFIKSRERHLRGGSKLKFSWVRGHNGNELNELADKLAEQGRISNEPAISCKANN